MKILLYLTIFFVFTSCSVNKGTYWCGDHPCINKKERRAYFEKTMTVEVKEFNKKKDKNYSEIQKLMQQAKINEKKRIKDANPELFNNPEFNNEEDAPQAYDSDETLSPNQAPV